MKLPSFISAQRIIIFLMFSATGCSPSVTSPVTVTPSQHQDQTTRTTSVNPTATELPVSTPSTTPEPVITFAPSPAQASTTPSTAETEPTPITPTSCLLDECTFKDLYFLSRPIPPDGRDWIDYSYRYGTTMSGEREPHHGVEFLNSTGTPVLAAADGVVVVAGEDYETVYGLFPGFYGNLVIIRHESPGYPVDADQPFFTLYAHLSQILVESGESVSQGEQIGKVGMAGAATGSHLHFEVRLGSNSYSSTSNPELWLAPGGDVNDNPGGLLAGRVLDTDGNLVSIVNIVLESVSSNNEEPTIKLFLKSYADDSMVGNGPWSECFAAGDLPAGSYRISLIKNGFIEKIIQIKSGQLTLVTIRLESQD